MEKKASIISEGSNFTAVSIGMLDELANHLYHHPRLNVDVPGKVFVGELLQSKAAEVSFQVMEPKAEISFMHRHHCNEEIYIFLKGSGEFLVDEARFEVKEGTIIRVAPSGSRSWRNIANEPLTFICIQAKEGSADGYGIEDGYRTDEPVRWSKP